MKGPVPMMGIKPVQQRGVKQWLTSEGRVSPLSPRGRALLNRITDYVWREAQGERVKTQDDYEDFTAALFILGSICKGWSSPVLAAYYYAFGVHPFKYRRYRLQRRARMAWELAKLTPKRIARAIPVPQRGEKKPAHSNQACPGQKSVEGKSVSIPRQTLVFAEDQSRGPVLVRATDLWTQSV
jgi:hypothetical protein